MTIQEVIAKQKYADIFSFPMNEDNVVVLDFTENNPVFDTLDINSTEALSGYVTACINNSGAIAGVGGYNEERVIYKRSPLFFDGSGNPRYIHLGIDIWVEPDIPVHAPLLGVVHSLKDNRGFGDFGPTIILKHNIEGIEFFTLYGHLSEDSLLDKKVGDNIKTGQEIASIGAPPINGDWPPHLHFQLILDMLDYDGDYAAVCSLPDREKFLALCPNPNLILGIPVI